MRTGPLRAFHVEAWPTVETIADLCRNQSTLYCERGRILVVLHDATEGAETPRAGGSEYSLDEMMDAVESWYERRVRDILRRKATYDYESSTHWEPARSLPGILVKRLARPIADAACWVTTPFPYLKDGESEHIQHAMTIRSAWHEEFKRWYDASYPKLQSQQAQVRRRTWCGRRCVDWCRGTNWYSQPMSHDYYHQFHISKSNEADRMAWKWLQDMTRPRVEHSDAVDECRSLASAAMTALPGFAAAAVVAAKYRNTMDPSAEFVDRMASPAWRSLSSSSSFSSP